MSETLRELHEAATPQPQPEGWVHHLNDDGLFDIRVDEGTGRLGPVLAWIAKRGSEREQEARAELIVALHNAAPELLTVLDLASPDGVEWSCESPVNFHDPCGECVYCRVNAAADSLREKGLI